MLLDAIFAFSARDLSLRLGGSYSADMADEYHDSCVHRLIPALEDLSLATESALPVSTVILRMHEMLSNEIDFQRHLRGCISLFRYNRNKFRPGSLQHTAFWTYVRQEILTALANSSATHVDTSDRTYKVVFSGETDDDWTNNITWLTAQVINYCFDPQVASSAEQWDELHLAVESWRERLPDTFRPLSVVADDESFPIITHLCTWHGKPQYYERAYCWRLTRSAAVVGMQFYHLCEVLLALHYPFQSMGISMLRLIRRIEVSLLL